MRRLRSSFTVLTLSAAALACATCFADSSLPGFWSAGWINDTNGYYREFSRTFTENQMKATTRTVIDDPAQGMYAMDIEMHYTYSLGASIPGIAMPGGTTYALDLVSEKVVLIPQSQSAAGYFRNVVECGISTWQVGVPQDVSGRDCRETGPGMNWFRRGDYRAYEIIGIADGLIRTANLEDDHRYNGTSPAARPRTFTPYQFRKID